MNKLIQLETILLILKNALLSSIPLLIKYFLDQDLQVMNFTLIVFVLVALLIAYLVVSFAYQNIHVRKDIAFYDEYKTKLMNHILEMTKVDFTQYQKETLLSYIENDSQVILNDFINNQIQIKATLVNVIYCLVVVLLIDVKLMVLLMILMIVSYYAQKLTDSTLDKEILHRQESREAFYVNLGNFCSCESLINDDNFDYLFNQFSVPKMQQALDSVVVYGKKKCRNMFNFNLVLNLEKVVGMLVLLLVYVSDTSKIGTAILFYSYLDQSSFALSNVFEGNMTMKAAKTLNEKIEQFLQLPIPTNSNNPIETIQLDKIKLNHVLSTINVNAMYGQTVLIYGNIGTGKSTLLRFLNQESIQIEGDFKINGENVSSLISYEDQISYLTQNINLSMVEEMKDYKTEMIELAYQYGEMDIPSLFHRDFETLSSGEKQKLLILFNLVQPTSLKLFDEPLSHLDTRSKEVYAKMIAFENHQSINFIISHELIDALLTYCEHHSIHL